MRCPSCKREFHLQPDASQNYWVADEDESAKDAFGISVQLCPSCHEMLVIYRSGIGRQHVSGGNLYFDEVNQSRVIYPEEQTFTVSGSVPQSYRNELEEAQAALDYSAKASAALSRRLLQRIFREALDIKKRDLSLEIDSFIESSNAPTYLTDAVDAVRQIGNFASHPIKYTNTGEIVDVAEGEAEWLIEVLVSLCDFVFVQPEKLKKRREELNEKLSALGKPPLKGA